MSQTEYNLAELNALGVITGELRALDWYPARRYLCGCAPERLCPVHTEQRAIDHYHPETTK